MQSSSTVPLLVHEARSRRNSAVVYDCSSFIHCRSVSVPQAARTKMLKIRGDSL